jgi:2,4-dienoyl-CoA reductase-like NADH-dependent reductase (Old Yellow Enzyme family)
VSSGGNAKQQDLKGFREPAYQAQFSEAVKKSVGDKLLVSSVGNINTGKIAQKVLDDGQADVVFSGRWFQKNPSLVWTFADELGVNIALGNQMEWPFRGRDYRQKKLTFWKERL